MADQPGCECSICANTATDTLRDKIAAVLNRHQIEAWSLTCRCSCLPDAWLASREDCQRHMADAVIRELGLERETWNPDMGVSVLPRHMWVKPTPVYRYVTDWVQTND